MKSLMIYLLIFVLITFVIPEQLLGEGELSDSYLAKANAERAANREVSKACWFGTGMTMVGSGVAWVWHSASPDPAAFVGKSPEYIRAYTDAYNSRVKKIQTIYSCLGCGTTLTMAGCALLMIELNKGCQDWSDENCFPDACYSSFDESSCINNSGDGSSCGNGSSCGSGSAGGSSCGSGSGG
jgi:uncharacterized membrane protein YgcG